MYIARCLIFDSEVVYVLVEASWNVLVHAQKPDFVFRRNGGVHLNLQGASIQSNTGSRVVCISGSNSGYTMFRGSVKSTGYPLHSPVSPSLPLPCVIVCHQISTGVYTVYTLTVRILLIHKHNLISRLLKMTSFQTEKIAFISTVIFKNKTKTTSFL